MKENQQNIDQQIEKMLSNLTTEHQIKSIVTRTDFDLQILKDQIKNLTGETKAQVVLVLWEARIYRLQKKYSVIRYLLSVKWVSTLIRKAGKLHEKMHR